ncbi:MAG TPA: shikimate dehydrogenase [Chitinophagaceae bacterium]|nr:shikimate dehydrogenase [Chitinophagaceae bacterium]
MKLYGLIGYPLGHSFSKKYFTQKFERENLSDCSYELFPIPSIKDLPPLINSTPILKGFNVTIPYKQQVLEYVTEKSDTVNDIGAANTIKIIENKLIAYNTDVAGFEKSFVKKLKPFHKKALVLGTGGSSKAIQFVLNKLGIDCLFVSRSQQPSANIINYSMIDEHIMNQHKVIINCTPVGMSPNENKYPQLPFDFVSKEHYLFDLVYKPDKTIFLQKGEEKGAIIQNGYEMLVIQAEESWKIWNED